MQSTALIALIDLLTRVQQRPGMYLGHVDALTLNTYLNGLYTGLEVMGYRFDRSVMNQITCERGWEDQTSWGAYPAMRAHGLTETAIVHEELTIHITMWQRMRMTMDNDNH